MQCRLSSFFTILSKNIIMKVFFGGMIERITYFDFMDSQGRRHGGGARGAKAPLKISKKGKMKKYVFSGIKVIKISFSVIFNEEIHALEGLLSRF